MKRAIALGLGLLLLASSAPAEAAGKGGRAGARHARASKSPSAPTLLAAPSPLPPPAPIPAATTEVAPTSAFATTIGAPPSSPEAAPVPPPVIPGDPTVPRRGAPSSAGDRPADADAPASDAPARRHATAIEAVFGRSPGMGWAFGARVHHTLRGSGFTVGGAVITFIEPLPGGVMVMPTITGEVGHEFRASTMKFVPYLGVGAATLVAPTFVARPLLTPGFAVRYEPPSSGVTAGIDLRFHVAGEDQLPLGLFFTIGGRT